MRGMSPVAPARSQYHGPRWKTGEKHHQLGPGAQILATTMPRERGHSTTLKSTMRQDDDLTCELINPMLNLVNNRFDFALTIS